MRRSTWMIDAAVHLLEWTLFQLDPAGYRPLKGCRPSLRGSPPRA